MGLPFLCIFDEFLCLFLVSPILVQYSRKVIQRPIIFIFDASLYLQYSRKMIQYSTHVYLIPLATVESMQSTRVHVTVLFSPCWGVRASYTSWSLHVHSSPFTTASLKALEQSVLFIPCTGVQWGAVVHTVWGPTVHIWGSIYRISRRRPGGSTETIEKWREAIHV